MKKRYVYYAPNEKPREFKSLAEMREYAQDTAHNGDYYIGVPDTFRSYHYNRANILKKFDDSHNT